MEERETLWVSLLFTLSTDGVKNSRTCYLLKVKGVFQV